MIVVVNSTTPTNVLAGLPKGGYWVIQNEQNGASPATSASCFVGRTSADATAANGFRLAPNQTFGFIPTFGVPSSSFKGTDKLWVLSSGSDINIRIFRLG